MKEKFQELQKKLDELDKVLYPGNDTMLMTLGVVEECGELFENIQKNDIEEIKDSIADIVVFAVQVASFEGIDFYTNLDNHNYNPPIQPWCADATEDLVIAIGRLCHHILKRKQGLGRTEDHFKAIKEQLANITYHIAEVAKSFNFDWREVFVNVVESDILKRERKGREQRYIESKGQ